MGGPLYPPIDAFVYYPLTFLPPRQAYRVAQGLGLSLGFLAALAFWLLNDRRVWYPVWVLLIVCFPGFGGSLLLGQNAALTLNLLVWGWLLMSRNRPLAGGFVWGLLAYKPVWALSFFLVPLLTRRWRMCATMVATGTALVVLTLPWVGLQRWREWVSIGREATQTYYSDENWIALSRDLLSFPRRWLDFESPSIERRDTIAAALIGWCLLVGVLEFTVRWSLLRQQQTEAVRGHGPAFLLLGAWLSCFHFMYYDVLLAALPVLLLLVGPWEDLKRRFLSWKNLWILFGMEATALALLAASAYGYPGRALGFRYLPYELVALFVLWMWCGWNMTPATLQRSTSLP